MVTPVRGRTWMPSPSRGIVPINRYLHPKCVVFLEAVTRDEAIDRLINSLDAAGKLPNRGVFRKAIFERESLVSTGIGMNIAIPHAKNQDLISFFIAVGIQKEPGIDWPGIDHLPVRIIFLVGGPDKKPTEYLQILSKLTQALKDPEVRRELMRATTPEEVIAAFKSF